jgi:hypothetical protein
MRRAFRVAATFAGAAAGAAAFAPAAAAATVVPDRPDTIVFNNCKAGESHFVHLYFPASRHHGPQCLGYDGSHAWYPDEVYQKYCAGNNFGYIGILGHVYSFGPGQRASGNFPVSFVTITGHTGNATCP